MHRVPHSSRAHGTVLSLQTSLDQKRERKCSHRAVLYIVQNMEI